MEIANLGKYINGNCPTLPVVECKEILANILYSLLKLNTVDLPDDSAILLLNRHTKRNVLAYVILVCKYLKN